MRETMLPRAMAALGLLLLVTPTVLAGQRVDGRLLQAQSVALGYDLGDRFLSERDAISQTDRVTPEDRLTLIQSASFSFCSVVTMPAVFSVLAMDATR